MTTCEFKSSKYLKVLVFALLLPFGSHSAFARQQRRQNRRPRTRNSRSAISAKFILTAAGRYTLNGVELPKLTDKPLLLSDSAQSIKVRATFLETVKVSSGEAVYDNKKALVEVGKAYSGHRPDTEEKRFHRALKPVLYDLPCT